MMESSKKCSHDLTSQYGAVDVGYCPICSSDSIGKMVQEVARMATETQSLKSLLRSAHEIIKTVEFAHSDRDGKVCECYFCGGEKILDFEKHYDSCKLGEWLTAYSSLTSSKSGMGE